MASVDNTPSIVPLDAESLVLWHELCRLMERVEDLRTDISAIPAARQKWIAAGLAFDFALFVDCAPRDDTCLAAAKEGKLKEYWAYFNLDEYADYELYSHASPRDIEDDDDYDEE